MWKCIHPTNPYRPVGEIGASCIQGQFVTDAFCENRIHMMSPSTVVGWYMYVQLQRLCLGQVVTIVLGQVVTTVTTLGRLVPMIQPASRVLTMTERTTLILFNYDV